VDLAPALRQDHSKGTAGRHSEFVVRWPRHRKRDKIGMFCSAQIVITHLLSCGHRITRWSFSCRSVSLERNKNPLFQ
jgi:hypothetical protein